MSEVRFPKPTDRTVVLGRTGSGKTVFALYLLSQANWHEMPWVIIDYKREDFDRLQSLFPSVVKYQKLGDKPPKKPGIYILQPRPKLDDDAVETFLMQCYEKHRIGLYVDEGFALPDKDAFDIILTQGRALKIPVIALYQRPVYMSRYAVAQANFFACFDQNDERDLKTTQQFVKPAYSPDGDKITLYTELPEYYCLWYDVGKGRSNILSPCPSGADIDQIFSNRINPKRSNSDQCSMVTLC